MDEYTTNTGERIKDLRREMGLSQMELAERLGVGKTTVSNYEVNYGLPSAENIKKLAEIFDVSIDYLLGETEFKDRFVNFIKGRKIPMFNISDTQAIIGCDISKIEGYLELPDCYSFRTGDFFAVRYDDNSMDKAKLEKNSYVVIKRTNNIADGKCAAVIANKKFLLRRVFCYNGITTLVPDSADISYLPVQYNSTDVRILGAVIKVLLDVE